MPRTRLAIAHYPGAASAAAARKALAAQGASAVTQIVDGSAGPDAAHRLEVVLPAAMERRFLDILLASDATRVDIHDVN